VKLAVRNAVKPSKVLRVIYRVPSVADPRGTPLEIVIEANVTERKSYRPISLLPFSYLFRDEMVATTVNGFEIHEMLGTKMRALFQRRRGRDLFDLYWALTEAGTPVNPAEIIELFLYYLQQEGTVATRDEFIGLLQSHLNDRGFLTDMNALLRTGIAYDPVVAGDFVIRNLLQLLPE
jgi:predicted nucleotidyltransferase component of viral defense system